MINEAPKPARRAVFVVGRTGSGKTTLSNNLGIHQFTRISASRYLQALFSAAYRRTPSAVELADFGQSLRAEGQLAHFHNSIKEAMGTTESCVIDGLRFYESYIDLSKAAREARLIFLHCHEDIRSSRLEREAVGADHETEIAIDGMRQYADVFIDTSASPADVFGKAEAALKSWRML